MNIMTSRQEEPEIKVTRAFIDRETLIPISVVFAVLSVGFGAFAWLNNRFDQMDKNQNSATGEVKDALKDFGYRIKAIEDRLDSNSMDRWTGTDMKLWVLELRQKNPSLVIPDPIHHSTGSIK